MRIFYRVCIITFMFAATLVGASNVNLSMEITPKHPYSGEEVKIVVNVDSTEKVKVEFPNLDKIASLPILAIRDNKEQKIVKQNGQELSVVRQSRSFTIAPTKSIKVAPITVVADGKKYKTKEQEIKIATPQKNGSASFIFRMSSDRKEVVVGEPFIVKVELIEPLALSGANLEYKRPKFQGFKVSMLGDGQTIKKGNRVIRTIEYLLTPKKPGHFTIDPATARIGLETTAQVQSPFAFFGADTRWKNLSSNRVSIDVAALPEDIGVVGEFTVAARVDKSVTSANQPVNLTLTIEGQGSLEEIESPKFTLDNVTVYSKDAKIEHIMDSGVVRARYTKKYVFISNSDFVIPRTSIIAFNPKSKTKYTLATPSYHIHVKKPESITSILNKPSTVHKAAVSKIDSIISPSVNKSSIEANESAKEQIATPKSRAEAKIEDILLDKNYYYKKYAHSGYRFETLAATSLVSFALGVLVALFLPKIWRRLRKKPGHSALYGSYEEALNILYPHTNDSPNIEEMVKKLYEVVNGNKEIVINNRELEKMVKKVLKKKG